MVVNSDTFNWCIFIFLSEAKINSLVFYGCLLILIYGVLVYSTALAKCHRLGGLNIINIFLTILEAGKPKIKMLADSLPR